jgi:hypothetical protein
MPPHPSEPDDELASSFARLIDRFWAGNPPSPPGRATDFLLQQLGALPGARLLCCSRSILAHASSLAGRGCIVFAYPPTARGRAFDGSLWCSTELVKLDEPALRARLADIAAHVSADGRLLIDLGGANRRGLASDSHLKPLLAEAGWSAADTAWAPDGHFYLVARRLQRPDGQRCCNCHKPAPVATNL